MDLHIIEFGAGTIIIGRGSYDGKPALFLEPAEVPGVPGAIVPRDVQSGNDLAPASTVLTFDNLASAEAMRDMLSELLGSTETTSK